MKICNSLFLLLTFSTLSLTAQTVKTHLFLDKLNYGTGEVVHGYFVLQGANFNNKSLRLELIRVNSGELVYETSIKISDNNGTFYIPISTEMKSGTYALYLQACRVENVTTRNLVIVANTSLNIISSSESKVTKEAFFEQKIPLQNLLGTNSDFALVSEYKQLNNIYEVSFPHNLSEIKFVSAFDLNTCHISSETKNWDQNLISSFSEKIFYVLNIADDKGQKQFGLIGLYSDYADKLYISKSDVNGNAIFLMDDYEGSHNFNIFVLQNYNAKPVIFEKKVKDQFNPISENSWNKLQEDAENIRKRANIHHYFEVNTFSLNNPKLIEKNVAPKPFWNITPNTYKKFPDLQSFCKENSLDLRFKNRKEMVIPILTPTSRFTNTYEKVEWEYPFFIIDGKAENDYKKIAAMKPEDINNLLIFYDKKEIIPWLYAFGSNGIVKIETKNKNNVQPQLKINGYQIQCNDQQTIISEAKSNNKPILTPTIFWKPVKDQKRIQVINNSDHSDKTLVVFYINNDKLYYNISALKAK